MFSGRIIELFFVFMRERVICYIYVHTIIIIVVIFTPSRSRGPTLTRFLFFFYILRFNVVKKTQIVAGLDCVQK